jgi:thiamine-phosphate diphosphorylase
MATSVVRSAFPGLLIGRSVHAADEAELAAQDADFVLFGPVFSTPGKGTPAGIEEVKTICDRLGAFPVLAVGGITAANAVDVLSAGAAGIAAIRQMNDPASLREIMAALGQ